MQTYSASPDARTLACGRCPVAESTLDLSTDSAQRSESGEPEPRPRSRAGVVTRLLWSCAGADADILERCPHSDSVKFQGMGGVVLATAVLALASGSYAFYTVFEPKTGTALSRELHIPTLILSAIAGIVWGFVI